MKETVQIVDKKIKNPKVRKTEDGFICLNDISNAGLNEWFESQATYNYFLEFSNFYNEWLENVIKENNGELWASRDVALDFIFWLSPELRLRNSQVLTKSIENNVVTLSPKEIAYNKLKWTILNNVSYYGIDLRDKFYEDIEAEVDDLIDSLNDSFNEILANIHRWDSLKEEWTSVRALNYSHYSFTNGQLRAIGRIATAIHWIKKIKFNDKTKPNLYRKDVLVTIMEFADSTKIINSVRLEKIVDCYLSLQLNEPNTIEQLELKNIRTD